MMAQVFKSSVTGRGKGNSQFGGLKGPLDFHTLADFSRGRYVVEGAEVGVGSVITTARDGVPANIFAGLTEGVVVQTVPADTPRVSFHPPSGMRGLICETARYNFIGALGDALFNSAAITRPYAAYAVGGSLTVTPRSGVVVLSGEGTLDSPQFFTHDGNNVGLEWGGNPHFASVEQLVQTTSPSIVPPPFLLQKQPESQILPIPGTDEGTLVLRVVEHPRASPIDAEGRAYAEVLADDQFIRVRRQRLSGQMNVMMHAGRVLNIYVPETVNTLAMTWGAGVSRFALNGFATTLPGEITKAVSGATLGTFSSGFANSLGGLVPAYAYYPRALSLAELRLASTSWST